MSVAELSDNERGVVRECLAFVVSSGELAGEFHTRMGVSEDEVHSFLRSWPDIDDHDDSSGACLAVNNALNEVAHGFRISDAEWARSFTCTRDAVLTTYKAWVRSRGWKPAGLR